jgi:uncharacterized protein (TIGR02246 family)
MKRFLILGVFISSTIFLFAQKKSTDSIAIHATIQRFEDSWNRNDMDAYCNFFMIDGSWINIGGMRWKNRTEVSAAMHALAPVFKNMIPQKLNIQNIQFVADGVAVVFVLEVMQMNHDWFFPDGKKGAAKDDVTYGQVSLLMVRSLGQWKIKAGHNTTVDPTIATFNPVK